MVSANLIERTIIQDIGAYSEYPFEAIEEPVLNLLKRASSQVRKCGTPVIKAFECFFQITNGNLTMEMLCDKQFLLICQTFIGAIYSSNFYQARTPQRYAWANLFISILRLAKHEQPALIVPKIDISTMGLTDYVKSGMDQFEAYSLNEEKIWLWSGWPSTNRSGRTTWLPLYLIYTRLGREYTQRLHKVCDEYYSGRKSQRIIALQDLARFIHSHPKQLTPDLLKSASFSTQFWREFEVPPLNSAKGNLVKSVFEKENGLEEAVFRRADHRIFEAGGSWRAGEGIVSSAWIQ